MKKNNRGTVTIEAAVIVPLFTIVVVMLIQTAIKCLDRDIVNCVSDKLCMDAEFLGFKSGKYDKNILRQYSEKANTYLQENTVSESYTVDISEELLVIKTDYGKVDKNNPVQYVRTADAAEKLLTKVKK
jgi:hypothetical protein